MFESLETRRLFAISLDSGLLTVEGNKKDELITIYTTAAGTQVQIQRNLQTVANKTFTSKIDLIKVFGKDGSDTIQMLAAVGSKNSKAKIFGGPGTDSVSGGTRNDTVLGGPGDDLLVDGGAGNDLVKGNGGDDNLRGRAGNDTLIGGKGLDLMQADEGNDVFKARDGKADNLVGGIGDDTAFVDFTIEPFHVLNSLDGLGTDGEIEEVITG